MGLCINVATKYVVKTKAIHLNDAEEPLWIDKINNFIDFLRKWDTYWSNAEDDIPYIIEIDKSEIIEYLDCDDVNLPYRETLAEILEISDQHNDFIHLEIR